MGGGQLRSGRGSDLQGYTESILVMNVLPETIMTGVKKESAM